MECSDQPASSRIWGLGKVSHLKKIFESKHVMGERKNKGTGIVHRKTLTPKIPSGLALLEIWKIQNYRVKKQHEQNNVEAEN